MLALALVVTALAAAPVARRVRPQRARRRRRTRRASVASSASSPASPLDPEVVRRGVELIFATGRFEDVQVDLLRSEGEAGIDVVFRPIPAPLLVAVEVAGDRVISAGAIQRMARLRRGDPLWPARLERAGRDVALELARRGLLEALVEPSVRREPRGSVAVFRIHAGPRVRVSSVRVESADAVACGPAARARPPAAGRDVPQGEGRGGPRVDAPAPRRGGLLARGCRARGDLRPVARAHERRVPGDARAAVLDSSCAAMPSKTVSSGRCARSCAKAAPRATASRSGPSESRAGCGAWVTATRSCARASSPAGRRRPWSTTFSAGPAAQVAALELRGADPALLAGLRSEVGRPLEDGALGEDARLVRTRLEALGHFEARVDAEVADGGGSLPVVFVARAGPRAVVREVRTLSPPLPLVADAGGPEELALREGLPYRVQDVARSRETLLSAWRRAGHLEAQVTSEVLLSEAKDEARVSLVVEPGERTIVEHVVLAGLDHTRDVTVEREMLLRPGDTFSFERVLESQRRLSSLGIFERVQISELDPDRERRRDVVVRAQEAPRTSWSWGIGYSEQDRIRGSVELTRRNIGGLGRTASVFARGSFRGSRFLFNLREPWLLGRRLDSFLTGFWEEEDRTSFDYNRLGGIVQAGRALDSRTSLILRYLYQDTNVFNIEGRSTGSTGSTAPTPPRARRRRSSSTRATTRSSRGAGSSWAPTCSCRSTRSAARAT